jgi:hypothetical protein
MSSITEFIGRATGRQPVGGAVWEREKKVDSDDEKIVRE